MTDVDPAVAQPVAVVTARSSTEWNVGVTRTQGARSATATVVVLTAPTKLAPAPHAEVAAAAAWLSLAHSAFEAGVFSDAVAAARQGITELGREYRPKLAKDDTSIRMAMADESLKNGDDKAGATGLIAVLDARIYLYLARYADSVHR